MKLLSVVGTRPNFMKLGPVARALALRVGVDHIIVHTGQHYDGDMSGVFFDQLRLPRPDHHLAVGSGTAALQTAAILERLDPVLEREAPDAVIVYGDVNSTMAATLCAAQRRIPVAHVEAGLRSRDRMMPEELNRIITDHSADLLLAPSADAVDNLRAEGIAATAIKLVGNVMIDTLVDLLPTATARDTVERHGLRRGEYIAVTLHRPSNVDDPARLAELLSALVTMARDRDVIFPVHPRTRQRMAALGPDLPNAPRLRLIEPLGYVEMLALVSSAAVVVTDSGGLQEETTFLGIPCLTVRRNTERPITCDRGTNRLVRPERAALLREVCAALQAPRPKLPPIERWDGHAGERIAEAICDFVGAAPARERSGEFVAPS